MCHNTVQPTQLQIAGKFSLKVLLIVEIVGLCLYSFTASLLHLILASVRQSHMSDPFARRKTLDCC